jgi:hypothetical protein
LQGWLLAEIGLIAKMIVGIGLMFALGILHFGLLMMGQNFKFTLKANIAFSIAHRFKMQ